MTNPLLPAAYDIWWSAATVVLFALLLIALISIARHAKRLPSGQALMWTVVAILIPVLGPTAWFAIGRRADATKTAPEALR
ncbi:PLDc N-terminal domain-containing protein [Microbacterium sp. P04]|uniref:PLDc N-terminal domain-containing protein n=1 Tax=Microbacterium sp. P04 TaxID=3366947 RepID=UPI003745544B